MIINSIIKNKRKTILSLPIYIHISKHTMRKAIQKVAETVSKTTVTKSAEETSLIKVSTRAESCFIITDQESAGDTSTTNHPTGTEISCGATNCEKKNCTKDVSECDPDTQEAKKAFHITHSLKGVEPDRVTTELKNSAGNSVFAIIHKEKEEAKQPYDKYRHKDTVMVQEDSNTKALQEALKKQQEKNNNEENK